MTNAPTVRRGILSKFNLLSRGVGRSNCGGRGWVNRNTRIINGGWFGRNRGFGRGHRGRALHLEPYYTNNDNDDDDGNNNVILHLKFTKKG